MTRIGVANKSTKCKENPGNKEPICLKYKATIRRSTWFSRCITLGGDWAPIWLINLWKALVGSSYKIC